MLRRLLALLLLALLVAGCPVGISHPLGVPGTEKIDRKLLGTWSSTNPRHELQRVKITKRDRTSYRIEVLEVSDAYMADAKRFTGWVTVVAGQPFLYAQPEGDLSYYTYAYELDGKQLLLSDVSLLVGGVAAVTSTEAYRAEVAASLERPGAKSGTTAFARQ